MTSQDRQIVDDAIVFGNEDCQALVRIIRALDNEVVRLSGVTHYCPYCEEHARELQYQKVYYEGRIALLVAAAEKQGGL